MYLHEWGTQARLGRHAEKLRWRNDTISTQLVIPFYAASLLIVGSRITAAPLTPS